MPNLVSLTIKPTTIYNQNATDANSNSANINEIVQVDKMSFITLQRYKNYLTYTNNLIKIIKKYGCKQS